MMKFKNPFKKEDKDKQKKLSENVVRINVKRSVGGLPYTIAEFDAIQDSDGSNNLILVNESANFKDDVEIVQDKVFSDLTLTLDLHKLSIEEKVTKLGEVIAKQETLIRSIDAGCIKKRSTTEEGKEEIVKVRVNLIDEEMKLKRYRVLLDHITKYPEGSYEEIDVDGRKRVNYLYKAGVLYPYNIGTAKVTMYPDITSKRKIYKTEQDIIDQEFINDQKGFMSGWKQYLWIGLIALMVIGNVYGYVKLAQGYAAFDEGTMMQLLDKAEGSAIKCAYYYATIGEETATFINAINQIELLSPNDNTQSAINVG